MSETETIEENQVNIIDTNIGYCIYGRGLLHFLFICGGVGLIFFYQLKKGYPSRFKGSQKMKKYPSGLISIKKKRIMKKILGCYKKDYPENVLNAFDPESVTIVCIDPPGYGKSRPPDRQQEVNRCKKDAKYCIGLMQVFDFK